MASENETGNGTGNETVNDQASGSVPSGAAIRELFADCDAVLFDCDGVLVNSEPISLATLVDVLAHFGAPLTLAEVAARFTGRSSSAPIDHIRDETGKDIRDQFKPFYYDLLFARYDHELVKIDGIDSVLAALKKRQLGFCISSSSSIERLGKTMDVTGLGPWFDGRIYSADFVANGKPAPDLFLYAADDMGYAPNQAIVVEDSVAGVTAAVAAGMKCIGFVGGGHYADDRARAATRLYDAGADIVLSDMMELSNALGEA
ncbi:MAG: hydrolase [Thalassospira sp.]|uniref:HAD family hydrolase n=1 Tax=Thalassospira sp. GB04J01 TaxID=1485225 RepID=UPI000C109012|nr:HAD family phosphatase [Thalassospira sp. GB04J01]MBV17878.1 hydrolase [Thalassospira sp.]|tara:strand:- start:87620 stop:88399 length:780 start_codon:yes stop_codon:yes gene_type:complete